ncbi:hypothetical protein M2146_003034 [Lachnospiraceae bacterium PF1-22]|uniref:anti-sigma-I factor RsgI family protein n=1 Tax=Ohessyouella blattaphilus TaxID=2949333 RepID=UPI003E20F9D3
MRQTGLVMEINNNTALIMLTGGEFKHFTAKDTWQVGDTVVLEDKKQRGIVRAIISLAASFFILLSAGIYGYSYYFTTNSVISVDINPSIEIMLNKAERVISSEGYNDEGTMILETLNLKNLKYTEALEQILLSEEMRPYLTSKDYLTLAVFSKSNENEILDRVKEIESKILSGEQMPNVECKAVNEITVSKAHSHNISAGKYSFIEELQEYMPNASVEGYTEQSIRDIKSEIESCKRKKERKREQLEKNNNDKEETSSGVRGSNHINGELEEGSEGKHGKGSEDNSGNKQGDGSHRRNGKDNVMKKDKKK